MIQKYNNYCVLGKYTAKECGNSVMIIGDGDILCAKINDSSAADMLNFLSEEGCVGIYKEDGIIKVEFEKEDL